MTAPTCKRCKTTKHVKLRRQISGNGATTFIWHCGQCGHVADNQNPFISKKKVAEWIASKRLPVSSPDDIPLANDYRETKCEVCGATGAEYHHWMPQCFHDQIDSAQNWPGAMLCKTCHDTWHETVTPYLPGRGKTSLARRTIERFFGSIGK